MAFIVSGCSTVVNNHYQKGSLVGNYLDGDNSDAVDEVSDKVDSRENTGDEIVWRLEACALYFYNGMYEEALKNMEATEKLMEEYDNRAVVSARDVGSEAGSVITNPNAIPYKGWARDRIVLNIYKALTYLALGREDSFRAQVKRLRDAQKQVQQEFADEFKREQEQLHAEDWGDQDAREKKVFNKYPRMSRGVDEMRKIAHKGYGNFLNPLGLYLSALCNLRDGDWSSAAIDTQRMHEALPGNTFVSQLHATVCKRAGRSLPPDMSSASPFSFPIDQNCLYVVFSNGRGAAFEPEGIHVVAEVSWPRLTTYTAPYRDLTVTANGTSVSTAPIANMDAILAQEFDARLPVIITRIAASTIVKEGVKYGGLAVALSSRNSTAQIVGLSVYFGMMIYNYIMNTADTRAWELLPKEYQVAQIPMPQDHKVHLKLNSPNGGEVMSFDYDFEGNAPSGVLFVNAPSYDNVTTAFLPFTSK